MRHALGANRPVRQVTSGTVDTLDGGRGLEATDATKHHSVQVAQPCRNNLLLWKPALASLQVCVCSSPCLGSCCLLPLLA